MKWEEADRQTDRQMDRQADLDAWFVIPIHNVEGQLLA
jgi:hypothetical protein